jgi:glycosyltransferase involved in cell wall biosynthesis
MHDVIHHLNRLEDPGFDYTVLAERGKLCDSPRVSYTKIPFLKHYTESYNRTRGISSSFANKKLQQFQKGLLAINDLQGIVWDVCRKLTIERSRKLGAIDVFHVVRPNSTSQIVTRILLEKNPDMKVVIGPNMMGYRDLEQDFSLEDFQHQYIKRFISISSHHKMLMEDFGIRGSIIERLPPTVDPLYFPSSGTRQPGNRLRIFYSAAQLAKEKGVSLFLQALHLLRAKGGIDFEVKIAGSDKINSTVQTPFDRSLLKGLEDVVTFVGKVERSHIARYLASSDVFVHAGNVENGPTTLIEALSCGTPCILPDNLCFREPELERACHFFKAGSSTELGRVIRQFHADWKAGRVHSGEYLPSITHADTAVFLRSLYQKTLS